MNVGTGFEENVPVPAALKSLRKPFAPILRPGMIDENVMPKSRSRDGENVRKSDKKVTVPERLDELSPPLPPDPLNVYGVKMNCSKMFRPPLPSPAGVSRVIVIIAEFTPLPLKTLSKPLLEIVGPSEVNEVNVRWALWKPVKSDGRPT